MKNISDYDERQLKLMLSALISYENNKIKLDSLVGTLEFLFHALEYVNEDWEENFLDEITILETINALTIIKESGACVYDIEEGKNKSLLRGSTQQLMKVIEEKLNGLKSDSSNT